MRIITEEALRSRGRLLAYAVMPNHLHLVFVQDHLPLAAFMQPLLRRIALLLHAAEGIDGHVFERRFRSRPCGDPDYLRNAIAYTHLNPVRAGLCHKAADYAWTSHRDYLSEATPTPPVPDRGWIEGLALFAVRDATDRAQLRADYTAFMQWRCDRDLLAREIGADHGIMLPRTPDCPAGDAQWAAYYGWSCVAGATGLKATPPSLDLRDLARHFLAASAPDVTLTLLRSGRRTRPLVGVRRAFIRWAKQHGHRNYAIAAFLHVSDAAVSQGLAQT